VPGAGTTKPFQPGIGAVSDSVGVGAAGQRALSIPCGLCAAKPSYALILGRVNICMCLLVSAMHACALAIARHQCDIVITLTHLKYKLKNRSHQPVICRGR